MANIENLFNSNGELMYPLTHQMAVIDNDGETLDQTLEKIRSGQTIQAGAIKKSHLADEAVTNSKVKDGTLSLDKIDPTFHQFLSSGAIIGDGALTPSQMSQLIVQETGTSEDKVMSQKAVSEKFINKKDLVNDLITGGVDKAISAEMGKELGKELEDLNLQVGSRIIEYTFSSTYAWSDTFNEIPIGTLVENIGDLQVKLYESRGGDTYTILPKNQSKYITHAVTIMRAEGIIGTAKISTRGGLSDRLKETEEKTDANTQGIIELSAQIASKVNKAYGKNLIDHSEDITDGKYLDQYGTQQSNVNYYITNYIKIEPSTNYYFSFNHNGASYPGSDNAYWAIYDEKLNVLLTGNTSSITSPENARFIRCSVNKSHTYEMMLEKGDVRTDYIVGSPVHKYVEHIENDIIGIKEDIGRYSEEKSLYLNIGSYTSVNDLSILKGDVITSFGGYEGALLLCPSKKFDVNNITKYLYVKDLPYTATEDIGSLRTNAAIDNYIFYLSKARGIKGDIEELNNKINAEVEIKPLGSSFKGDISNGDLIVLEKNSIKGEDSFSFCANIETFNKIKIGRGTPYEKLYSSSWLEIDNDNLVVKTFYTESNFKENSYPHELSITNNIQVLINCSNNHKAKVMIVSNGIAFEKEIAWNGCNGSIFVESDNTNLKGAVFSWTCKKLDAPIWMFGDSYFALNSESRWPYYLINNGYKDILINGFPGAASANGYNDVVSLLKHSTPKYIFWCMGMNNRDNETSVNNSWLTTFNQLKEICETNGIELVVSTIPTVKGGYVEDTQEYNKRIHKFKNAIVKESGLRYVDFEKAVGANEETGEWFGNMLSSDGVHPSADGARCLFMQAISDFPELMSAENY